MLFNFLKNIKRNSKEKSKSANEKISLAKEVTEKFAKNDIFDGSEEQIKNIAEGRAKEKIKEAQKVEPVEEIPVEEAHEAASLESKEVKDTEKDKCQEEIEKIIKDIESDVDASCKDIADIKEKTEKYNRMKYDEAVSVALTNIEKSIPSDIDKCPAIMLKLFKSLQKYLPILDGWDATCPSSYPKYIRVLADKHAYRWTTETHFTKKFFTTSDGKGHTVKYGFDQDDKLGMHAGDVIIFKIYNLILYFDLHFFRYGDYVYNKTKDINLHDAVMRITIDSGNDSADILKSAEPFVENPFLINDAIKVCYDDFMQDVAEFKKANEIYKDVKLDND